MNVSVTRNIPIAPRLPMAESFGEIGRRAISILSVISMTPISPENPRVVKTLYPQDISGLLATNPWMFSAS